jgi:predicted AAA+ superfamily ATPase
MIARPLYLNKLRELRDKHLIKVVSGVRRSGKSTLLLMFRQELLDEGVPPEQIQYYNFENPENLILADNWLDLYHHVVGKMVGGKKNYIFLDEIQSIGDFEQMVSGLFVKEGMDIYVTGSNAYFLSRDIATVLSGRMIEGQVWPLSFAEYISAFEGEINVEAKFQQYLKFGGLPRVIDFEDDRALLIEYLSGVYNTVLLKDVMQRMSVNDKDVMENVAGFMLDNIGNITTAKRIADTLTSKGRAISHSTIDKYISALSESLLFYSVDKVGLKGRKRLYSQKKYYAVDTGFRQLVLGAEQTEDDRGHVLENVVYLELLRRNLKVEFGRAGDKEVDFVVMTNDGITEYYQVAWTVRGEETRVREIAPLKAINDHNQKYLLTMDIEETIEDGIRQKNVIAWLLDI